MEQVDNAENLRTKQEGIPVEAIGTTLYIIPPKAPVPAVVA
jgi:hypothetical protein